MMFRLTFVNKDNEKAEWEVRNKSDYYSMCLWLWNTIEHLKDGYLSVPDGEIFWLVYLRDIAEMDED